MRLLCQRKSGASKEITEKREKRERERRKRAGLKGFRPSLKVDGVATDRLHPLGLLMPTEGSVSTSPV